MAYQSDPSILKSYFETQDTPDEVEFAELIDSSVNQGVIPLDTAISRKTAASYEPVGVFPGATKVTQTDTPGILWTLVATDVTLDASWIAQQYSVDPDGEMIIDLTLGDAYNLVPDANALNRFLTRPSLGDGVTTGGRQTMMLEDRVPLPPGVGYMRLKNHGAATHAFQAVCDDINDGGVCFQVNGGAVTYSSNPGFPISLSIPMAAGVPIADVLFWAATSATSGVSATNEIVEVNETPAQPFAVTYLDFTNLGLKRSNIKLETGLEPTFVPFETVINLNLYWWKKWDQLLKYNFIGTPMETVVLNFAEGDAPAIQDYSFLGTAIGGFEINDANADLIDLSAAGYKGTGLTQEVNVSGSRVRDVEVRLSRINGFQGLTVTQSEGASVTVVRAVDLSVVTFTDLIVSNLSMDAAAINQLFTDLDDGSEAIDITGNPGAATCDPTIATAKGYSVVGGP